MRYTMFVLIITVMILNQASYSHSPTRTKAPIAKHGGIAKKVGPYNIEFVRNGKCVSVYVYSKDNTELSITRSSAKAVMYVKGDNPELVLLPGADNHLYGCCDVILDDAKMAKMHLKIFGREPVSKLLVLK